MKWDRLYTPGTHFQVKGLHRLGDAVVGRRRDAVAADALEEAHRSRVASLGDREATGARRKGTPGAAPRLPVEASGRSFDAGASATARAAARHLFNDSTRPLRAHEA